MTLRKTLIVIALLLIGVAGSATMHGTRRALAGGSGACSTAPVLNYTPNTNWDYLTTPISATYSAPAGCTPQFAFYYASGSQWELFRPYESSMTAYFDSHNRTAD